MPWTPERYPVSMHHLSPAVRDKAIQIANALLEQGMQDGQAIRISIVRAKQWAGHHGLPERGDVC
jgi:uncharacterized protein YdaT